MFGSEILWQEVKVRFDKKYLFGQNSETMQYNDSDPNYLRQNKKGESKG